MIALLKEHLSRARSRMKQQVDKKRSEREFFVGEWVYVKLHPYQQPSVHYRTNQLKLAPKHYTPYEVIKKIGAVAYTLKLLVSSKIHPTFHVSLLKKHHGPLPHSVYPTFVHIPTSSEDKYHVAVINKRTVRRSNHAVTQWMIY